MANNTTLAVPSGSSAGDIIRDIDRAGVKTQVIQLDHGGAAAESLTSATNPLPVKLTDGTNSVTIADSSMAASETAVDRLKVNSALRLLDTAQAAGFQLVAAKGDQTSGLWVNVKASANSSVTLLAGAAIAGKFGIDQTTPGTTNLVSIGTNGTVTLAAGAAAIGTVGVTSLPALAAGAAAIGTVGVTSLPALTAGAAVIGALVANQSVNVAQMNGVAVTMGSGVVGTGVQRVVLATDVALPSAAAPSTTYSASIVGLATALTATDIFTITGSATKTVRVSRIVVNGVQTTAAQVNVLVIKRSTANTAGTSTAPTRVPYDSANAAVTATVLAYTANPTLGTTVGTVSARRAFIPGAATASDAQGLEIISGDVGQQMMTLRGIAEVLAVNLNATTVTGSAFNITVEWTEA